MTPRSYEAAKTLKEIGYICTPCDATLKNVGDGKVKYPPAWSTTEFEHPEDWKGYPDAAINTNLTDLVGFDIDMKKGKNGKAAMEKAEFKLPDTPFIVDTPSDGEHRVYRACPGVPIDTCQDVLGMEGVDVRALKNGNLICPGVEVSGKKYKARHGIPPRSELPELPRDIAERIAEWQARPKRALPTPPATPPGEVSKSEFDRLMRIVERKLDELGTAGPGDRWEATKSVIRIIGIGKALGCEAEMAERCRAVFPGDPDQIDSAIDRAMVNADPEVLPEDDVRGFWDQRPELQRIRQAAIAGTASPWAVLGAVCVRVLSDIPPGWALDTSIGTSRGNLNLFAVLAAASGGGKGIATETAEYLWPGAGHTYEVETASGESLPKLFANRDGLHRWSVIVDVDEYASLATSKDRSGSTLAYKLSSGWSGKRLSLAYSDESKSVNVPAGCYRLGMVAGIQYGNAKMLLASGEFVQGFPQRFLWFPADELGYIPADTGDIQLPEPFPGISQSLQDTKAIAVPAEVRALMRAARGVNPDGLDGHKLYARAKLAYALAVLSGHTDSIRDEDWELSGIVLWVSDRTRRKASEAMAERDRQYTVTLGRRDGLRQDTAAAAAHDAAVVRVARWISRKRAEHPEWSEGDLYRNMSGDDRKRGQEFWDEALHVANS